MKPTKFPQEGPEASAQGDLLPLERLYATQSDQQASLQGVMCQVGLWWELWQGQAGGGGVRVGEDPCSFCIPPQDS